MPAVSWPLACCRVNLQWATSPMKQEKGSSQAAPVMDTL